jgi:hypothetical protein
MFYTAQVNAYGNISGESWKVTNSPGWHFLKQAFNGSVEGGTYTYVGSNWCTYRLPVHREMITAVQGLKTDFPSLSVIPGRISHQQAV